LQLSQLAINLSQNQNQSCNEREPDKPMIASQGSYDCKPLQVWFECCFIDIDL